MVDIFKLKVDLMISELNADFPALRPVACGKCPGRVEVHWLVVFRELCLVENTHVELVEQTKFRAAAVKFEDTLAYCGELSKVETLERPCSLHPFDVDELRHGVAVCSRNIRDSKAQRRP